MSVVRRAKALTGPKGMILSTKVRERRTQAERTEETRSALIEAAIKVLHKSGYNAATNAEIAGEAGVSRGSIIYHFNTRAKLMSEVIYYVYEYEQQQYATLEKQGLDLTKPQNWLDMMWKVFSQPPGMAVIEILQASRSDPELAELVGPMQDKVEQLSIEAVAKRFPGSEDRMRPAIRLLVWAARGLVLAKALVSDPTETERAVLLFEQILERWPAEHWISLKV